MRLTQLSKAEARVAGIITQTNTKAKMQRAAAVRRRNSAQLFSRRAILGAIL